MKILLVTSDFPLQPDRVVGGVAGAGLYLVRAMRQHFDVEVEVLLANPLLTGPEAQGVTEVDGMRVHKIGRPKGWPFYASILWAIPRAVQKHIARFGGDIVHVQGMERIAARVQRPSVLTIHGINELDSQFRGTAFFRPCRAAIAGALARRARRRVRHVVAISPYVRQFLDGGQQQQVWDIANPVLDSFFAVKRDPAFGRVFSASRVSGLKNVAGLIRGFQPMAHQFPSAELRIAGPAGGAYEAECRALVRELHLQSQVRFLGPLAVPEIQQELARASCLALTSFRENAPLVISEAQAAGVPVLASRVGGVPHMIEEGITGRLVDPGNPADISRGLKQLHDGDDLAAFGRAARERAERSFRPAIVARQTLDVYRQILGQARAAAVPNPRNAEIRELEPAGF